jgi:hypothetical protein
MIVSIALLVAGLVAFVVAMVAICRIAGSKGAGQARRGFGLIVLAVPTFLLAIVLGFLSSGYSNDTLSFTFLLEGMLSLLASVTFVVAGLIIVGLSLLAPAAEPTNHLVAAPENRYPV